MKNLTILASFLFFITTTALSQKYQTLEIGQYYPKLELDYSMKSVYNQDHRMSQHFEKKGLLVIFTSNTCPFVIAWEDRYKLIEEICQTYDIDMLYVNSNHNKRDGDDSFKAMQKHAKEKGYSYPYLLDDKSRLANAIGAKTTPHVFLFDPTKKLVYKGAIDDNYESAKDVKEFYLKDALIFLSNGEEITAPKTKAVGCSIKRYTP